MNRLVITVCASIILAAYYTTLSPSISGGDSGELVAEGCSLGVAHPPGYPIFTMLVYALKSLVHVGSVAYRVNFSSTVFTTLAAYFIGEMVLIFPARSHCISGSVFAMTMFAFSPLIWQYAVTAEVFPMNTFFAAALCYLTMVFSKTRKFATALLGAFLCGLALCNQHTIVLFEAPLILWMTFLLRRYLYAHPVSVGYLGICFITGLLPYAYIPIVSNMHPQPGSWGHTATFSGFLHHFLRKDYGTFRLFSGSGGIESEGFSLRSMAYLQDVYREQGLFVSLPLAVFGMIMAIVASLLAFKTMSSQVQQKNRHLPTERKKNQKQDTVASNTSEDLISEKEAVLTAPLLVFAYLFYFAIFHSLANLPLGDKLLFGVHQRFWMQPNVLFFTFAGVGFNYITYSGELIVQYLLTQLTAKKLGQTKLGNLKQIQKTLSADGGPSPTADTVKPVGSGVSVRMVVGSLVTLILAYNQHKKWFFISDQSDAYSFRNYASAMLKPLPKNTLLLVNYDMLWTSIRYMQQCEGYRKDVTSINLSMMTYEWFEHKRALLPDVKFPALFHAAPGSPHIKSRRGFTMKDLLDSNTGKRRIFLGGKLSFSDPEIEKKYIVIPTGLATEFRLISNKPNATSYKKLNNYAWKNVFEELPMLPSVLKYPEETWEWTIGRDSKDRISDANAHLLDLAIPEAPTDPIPLIYAIYGLESSIYFEDKALNETSMLAKSIVPRIGIKEEVIRPMPPTALLKNAGLAHVYLMKNQILSKTDDGDPNRFLPAIDPDIFGTLDHIRWPSSDKYMSDVSETYIKWSSKRFLKYWGEFLKRAEAKEDPQYATIKSMYDQLYSLLTK